MSQQQPTSDETLAAFEKLFSQLEPSYTLLSQLNDVLDVYAWDGLRPFQQRRLEQLRGRIGDRLRQHEQEQAETAIAPS